jgi:hypothetical protein
MYMLLVMIPTAAKKGQTWYTVCTVMVLLAVVVSYSCLFWGNTHRRIARFLTGRMAFKKVAFLAAVDWMRLVVRPDEGWEVTDRVSATTLLSLRLGFLGFDSLKGVSRWFRLSLCFFFFGGNM